MTAPKILCVDDSRMIHKLITKALHEYEVELLFAGNGAEGVRMAAEKNPNLIFMDLTMPVMNGADAIMHLRADPDLRHIPIIMLTSEASKENVMKMARLGANDYIVKPFTERMLISRAYRFVDLPLKAGLLYKPKSFEDPATILVIDDQPAVVDQIVKALEQTHWSVVSAEACDEALDKALSSLPNMVLASLSLSGKAVFNFFRMMRSYPKTKSVPIWGLSVRTAADEQHQAQAMGFDGIILKPLDAADLMHRLARAMNLDVSQRYFHIDNQTLHITLPEIITNSIASEVTHLIKPKTSEIVNSGMNQVILDISQVAQFDMALIWLVLNVVRACRDLDLKYRVVGSTTLEQQFKGFAETKNLEIFLDKETALIGF